MGRAPGVKVPTLAEHAHGIEQAGAPELGTKQGHIKLQEPSLAGVSWRQVQLTAATDTARGGRSGLPSPAFSYRQEAVHEVHFGPLDGVNEGILPTRKGLPSVGSKDPCSKKQGLVLASPLFTGLQVAHQRSRHAKPGQLCPPQACLATHRQQH